MKEKVLKSIEKLEKWIEGHDYMAYEPFDALSSPLRPVLTCGNIFMERVLMQVVRRTPFNLRPFLGIRPLPSTKGRGYMAWGYLQMLKSTNNNIYKEKAFSQLEWLDKHKSPKFDNHSWSNHFTFSSRGGSYHKGDSIIVWTALIGQAYCSAYEMFGDKKHLEIIKSITRWILGLSREKTEKGTCISYLMGAQSSIHNSNMLGAAFLARAAKCTGDKSVLDVAHEAMLYSCSRQLSDGSWWYGEQDNNRWIDNFHTGYNLDSLKCYTEYSGDTTWQENIKRGFEFYVNNLFEQDGRPKYYHNKLYPIDSQCAGQAIETLATFSDYDPRALPLAQKVAGWWIDNMQDKDGHFYFRLNKLGFKDKTPMLHWSQAVTYRGLSVLLAKL